MSPPQFLYRLLVRWDHAKSTQQAVEARYQHLFDNMNEGVAYCRMIFQDGRPADFVYLAVNGQFTVLTGLKDVAGKRVSEVISGFRESDPDLLKIYGRVAQTGKPEKFERHVEALKLWFAVSAFCPEPGHFVAVFEMVTERKRAEEEVRWKTAFFEALVHSSQDGILVVDRRDKKIIQNQRMVDLWKIPPEIAKDPDDRKQFEFARGQTKDPAGFDEKTRHLVAGADGQTGDEIELRDGTVIERQTSLVVGLHGEAYGRLWNFHDITGRRLKEAALRASEEAYRGLFDRSLDCVFLSDFNGRFLDANPAALNLLGYTRTEITSLTFASLLSADQLSTAMESVANIRATGFQQVPLEFRLRAQNGREVQVETMSSLIYRQGRPFAIQGIARDITGRKRAEQQAKDAFNYLHTLLAASPIGIITYKASGQAVSANEAAARLVGTAVENIQRQNFRELESWRVSGFLIMAEQALGTGQEQVFEGRAASTYGVKMWLSCRFVPFTFAGEPHLLLLAQDISARKQAEATNLRLATAVEQAAETIVITDTAGNIEYVNPAFEQTTGYTAAEALGQNPRLLKSGKQDAEFYRNLWAVLRCGETWSGHFSNRRKNGTVYEEEATISPIRDATGKIVSYVAVKRDVTREVELEAQFRQSQKLEAVGQLASGVAHDFNNILAVIEMQAGLLRLEAKAAGTGAAAGHDHASEIEKACQRAANLTNQLLLFSRRQPLQLRDQDLNEVVTSIARMLQRVLGEDIQMQIRLSPRPLPVHADTGMMDQVLMNLTVNARDAMPKGGTLELETAVVEFDETTAAQNPPARPGIFACVRVGDTGGGIAPEVLPRIFEPFFTTKEPGKGTGLGLATVFGIVQQHHGWIEVASEPGRGTSFRIYLPRLAAPAGPAAGWSSFGDVRPGHETILLVEDDAALRVSIQGALAQFGYQVLSAASGPEAVAVWEAHRAEIRLLLTDLMMPGGMSGNELAERLLQQEPGLKVVYASGHSADLAGGDFPLKEGVNFLVKPFEISRLAEAVRNCLDKN